ncbi:hypothetical protein PR048_009751 [Dryococelus australis]|uniref:ATP-dependent DNA helicase n=1 Tax=Dryococelus australis TaxID=614101 RepID=A0ABQ9I2L6_9NEOP|nr:hypothetical protein PR048_009751 [Dryococelus australis]
MLTRNLDTKHGLCSCTRLVLINLNDHVIYANIITGSYKGDRAYIPRIKLLSAPTDFPFSFSRRQFPIHLAFTMTTNKSQGQTFNSIGIYLPNPVFTHGQLYHFDYVSVLAKQSSAIILPREHEKKKVTLKM